MPTPKELRRMADEGDAKAEELEGEAARLRGYSSEFRRMADEMDTAALTSSHRPSTVGDVSTSLSSNALRSQAQISDDAKKHRLVMVMTKRGLSFADIADALEEKLKPRKFPRSTVQSWVKPKSDASYRAIPQDAADALKALYGVPLSAWARVIPGT